MKPYRSIEVTGGRPPLSFDPRLPPAWIIEDLRRHREERQRREEEERGLRLPVEGPCVDDRLPEDDPSEG